MASAKRRSTDHGSWPYRLYCHISCLPLHESRQSRVQNVQTCSVQIIWSCRTESRDNYGLPIWPPLLAIPYRCHCSGVGKRKFYPTNLSNSDDHNGRNTAVLNGRLFKCATTSRHVDVTIVKVPASEKRSQITLFFCRYLRGKLLLPLWSSPYLLLRQIQQDIRGRSAGSCAIEDLTKKTVHQHVTKGQKNWDK